MINFIRTIYSISLVLGWLILIWFLPIYYIWCWKPNKSIKAGLNDWIDESADDF